MKTTVSALFVAVTLFNTLYSQTYEVRATNKGGGVVGIEMRCTSVAGVPTTANFVTDMKFGIRFSNVNTVTISTVPAPNLYQITKSGGIVTSGAYKFQSFFANNTPYNFPADWVQNTWVEIGYVNIAAGTGTDDFTICPTGYNVTTDPNFGMDLTDITPTINGSAVGVALPVELVSFTALAHGRSIELSWATKTETNNYGFEVQRSVTSQNPNWEKVGFIEGKGTTNAPQSYKYSDAVKSAGTYTYRLKQTDRDGKFTYSAQVEAKAALTADDYRMSQNYPNPFNPSTKFNFAVSTPQQVSVKVFNSLGQEVQTLFNGVAPADQVQEVTFDGARLASGIYFYVLRAQDRVEVKKMMMMK